MTSKRCPKAAASATRTRAVRGPNPPAQISGHWLLRALLGSLLAAAVCAYLSLCLLFYQGQWQIVFHPSRNVAITPASLGVPFDDIRFDATEAGVLQLDGWWIPADPAGRYPGSTLLFFHDGNGSLSDTAAQLKTLQALGINIFAFDYRGFGLSLDQHPSEPRVYEDADAAWNYLTDTRHLDPKRIVFYGQGLGATIAAEAALRHASSPALILENPASPGITLLQADPRTRLLPLRLLFQDRFELEPKIGELKTPKLLLQRSDSFGVRSGSRPFNRYYNSAADPKMLVMLGRTAANSRSELSIRQDTAYLESLRRFLDEQLAPR